MTVLDYGTIKRFDQRLNHLVREVTKLVALVIALKEEMERMSPQLEALRTKVQELTTVQQGAVTLLGTLSTMIRDLKEDPVALEGLAADIDAQKAALAQAVADNTPTVGDKK